MECQFEARGRPEDHQGRRRRTQAHAQRAVAVRGHQLGASQEERNPERGAGGEARQGAQDHARQRCGALAILATAQESRQSEYPQHHPHEVSARAQVRHGSHGQGMHGEHHGHHARGTGGVLAAGPWQEQPAHAKRQPQRRGHREREVLEAQHQRPRQPQHVRSTEIAQMRRESQGPTRQWRSAFRHRARPQPFTGRFEQRRVVRRQKPRAEQRAVGKPHQERHPHQGKRAT